jgi:hypothetical protein
MESKPAVDILIINVGEQIFIGRNTQCRRAAAPLDLKCAIGFDFRECCDCSLIGRDVAVAPYPDPMATGETNAENGRKLNDVPPHTIRSFPWDAVIRGFRFSKILIL